LFSQKEEGKMVNSNAGRHIGLPLQYFWKITFVLLVYVSVATTTAAQTQKQHQQAQLAISKADRLYYDGKYAEAVKTFKEIVKKYPNSPSIGHIRVQMGRCYAKLGNDASAIQSYRSVVDDNPNGSYVTSAVSLIGNLYVLRYQYQKATVALQQIAAKYPSTKAADMAQYLIPRYLEYQGETAKAIAGYESFLKAFPRSVYRSSALSSLVSLYLKHQKLNEAEQTLLKHINNNPNDVDLMRNLAAVYQKQGKLDKALKLYQTAIAKSPNNERVLEELGKLYLQKGDKAKAIAEWSKIAAGTRTQYYALYRLASIFKEHGFYDNAIEQYEAAIKLQPTYSFLYTGLAAIYKIQGKVDDAIGIYLRALLRLGVNYSGRDSIISDMSELYDGELQAALFDKAIAKVKAELKKKPTDTGIVLSLAEMYFHRGDFASSMVYFKQLAAIYPDQGKIFDKYARILERDNKPVAASEFYATIPRLFPTGSFSMRARLKSGQLYYQLGRYEDALKTLRELIRKDVAKQHSGEGYLLMGEVQLRGLRDVQAAASTYAMLERLSAATPNALEIRVRQAECLMLLGKYADAEAVLKPIAEGVSEFNVGAKKLLGDCYLFMAKFKDAQEEYQKIIALPEDTPFTNDALAQVAVITGNSDYFQQPLAMYAEALRLELNGDYDDALTAYNAIIKQFPDCALKDELILAIADNLLRRELVKEAIQHLEQLQQSDSPLAPEAQAKIGDIYRWQLKDVSQAMKAYSTLLEKYPNSVLTTYARNQILALKNR